MAFVLFKDSGIFRLNMTSFSNCNRSDNDALLYPWRHFKRYNLIMKDRVEKLWHPGITLVLPH